jgi:anti-sigma B factor antagonist
VSVTEADDPPRIVLSGEIDIACAAALRSLGGRLASALAAGDRLPVDVADVTFLDSSGVGALIAVRNAAAARGGSVVLRNLSTSVRRLFELSGLIDSFVLETDAE